MNFSKAILLYSFVGLLLLSCNDTKPEDKTIESVKKDTIAIAEQEVIVPDQKLTTEQQIAAAVLSAPEETRTGAKVYGYDNDGKFITLREGTNEMICIADDINKDGFKAVSYHKDLEPFMASGRALKASGKSGQDLIKLREVEAKDGKIKMVEKSATLHILQGNKGWYDVENNKIVNANYRYVVYIPFATQKSTGLSLKPNAPGHPWLMFPGTAGAHIMITPPAGK